jgi:hydrogenase/urease accessory protein HupE
MRHRLTKFLAISALFVPASAQAHPGPHRGELLWSLAHAVTQMDHLAAMAAMGAGATLAVTVAWPLTARRNRVSAR